MLLFIVLYCIDVIDSFDLFDLTAVSVFVACFSV